jgi:hypothetical protein
MEEMKSEITLTQYTTEKLTLWDILRARVSSNFKLKAESFSLLYGNCFGRKSKKNVGNFNNINIRGGYFELSEEPEDDTETEDDSMHEANTSVRRSKIASQTQEQPRPWPKLKRSGAIKGRKPRASLHTANNIHESRMVRAYVNSSLFKRGTSNGEASGNAETTDQAIAPEMKGSCFRKQGDRLLTEGLKQVRFAPTIEVVLEHQACEACEHRTQSKPCFATYNDEKRVSVSEPEDLGWTRATSGIRFLSTAKARQLLQSESYALWTMRPFLKRNMVCFAWGQCADPLKMGWLDGVVAGEVRVGLDVDCSWLSKG